MKLNCSSKHKIIPSMTVLANYLRGIQQAADELNMENYGGHKTLISRLAGSAIAEVDNIIRLDCESVNKEK